MAAGGPWRFRGDSHLSSRHPGFSLPGVRVDAALRLDACGPSMEAHFFLAEFPMSIHYPKRCSRIKRKRSIGFRARMRTKGGRKVINRQRRVGRSVNTADRGR